MLRLWAVALPPLVLWDTVHVSRAIAQTGAYRRECLGPGRAGPAGAAAPCRYLPADARLVEDYDWHGRLQGQFIKVRYADGRTADVWADRDPTLRAPGTRNPDLTPARVDGPCLVELWHGTVTAVYRPGLRVSSRDDPSLGAGTFPRALLLCSFGMMVFAWAYLVVLTRRLKSTGAGQPTASGVR